MMLITSSLPVLLSLGLVSQLSAQDSGAWGASDEDWLQDNDVDFYAKSSGTTDEEWLRDNDVEPSHAGTADRRDALKALYKALVKLNHLKTVKTKVSEPDSKGMDVSEVTKTSTEHSFLMQSGTTYHHNNMMEREDKSHKFTHSIRVGYGEPFGSLL